MLKDWDILDFADYICKKETFGNTSLQSENTFDVAFGVDKNFVPPMGIMITSILINNPKIHLNVYIFLDSILKEDHEKLKILTTENNNLQLHLYYLDVELFKNFQVSKGYPIAIYYRIIAAKILYPQISKLLYVDADTLCVGNILAFTKLSFDDNILMAVHDRGEWLAQHKREIGIPEQQTYFNSGVLYIDLDKWDQYDVSVHMLEMLRNKMLSFPDQDALNLIAGEKIKAIPVKFNQFLLMRHENDQLPNDTVIIHFAGQIKPWQPWCDNPQRIIYDEYRNKSLWKEFEYYPRDYQENRLMGKVARKQGHFLTAMKWYYLYVRDKFLQKIKR